MTNEFIGPTNPLVSVIIPCFNYGRYLQEAIQSVLNQSYPNIEVIVVDDGSTDNTASIASAYESKINYVYQENQGIGGARNTGIRHANGSFVSFLDADDIWIDNKLRLQVDYLLTYPNFDIVYGFAKQFYSPEVSTNFKKTKGYTQEIMRATISTALLVSKESFLRVGLFSDHNIAVDQDWYMRSMELNMKTHTLDKVVYLRRIHENNNGIVAIGPEELSSRLHVIKQSLDRRRLKNKLYRKA